MNENENTYAYPGAHTPPWRTPASTPTISLPWTHRNITGVHTISYWRPPIFFSDFARRAPTSTRSRMRDSFPRTWSPPTTIAATIAMGITRMCIPAGPTFVPRCFWPIPISIPISLPIPFPISRPWSRFGTGGTRSFGSYCFVFNHSRCNWFAKIPMRMKRRIFNLCFHTLHIEYRYYNMMSWWCLKITEAILRLARHARFPSCTLCAIMRTEIILVRIKWFTTCALLCAYHCPCGPMGMSCKYRYWNGIFNTVCVVCTTTVVQLIFFTKLPKKKNCTIKKIWTQCTTRKGESIRDDWYKEVL